MNEQQNAKFNIAHQKLKASYAAIKVKKESRKLIVLTTEHIENNIQFRKRRAH